ncbi:OmpA family protein [Algoriphagus winogradskyi]|uniref:OmpA family protein n=2 Tax=Algoriphagus winogradskyi TaxID=237017 RepID=A0ABY1PG33_9BACT|nr:OmpA family protein [Algoriphagus winogradskyi]
MKRLYSFLILIGLINANLLIEIPQALGSRIEKVYMPSKKDSLSNLGAKFVFDPTFHQRAKPVDDSRISSSKKNIADTRVLNSRSKQSNSMVLLVKDRGTGKPIDNTLVVLKLYETDTYTEYKTDDLGEISIPLTFSDSLVHISIAASGYVSIPECTIPVWDTAHLEVILQPLQLNENLVLARLGAAENGKTLTESDYRSLDNLIQLLHLNPDVRVDLKNHADSKHGHYYNQRISEKRAKLIVSYLINKGLDPNRIYSVSYGDSYPLVPCTLNCTKKQFTENSRTEVVFFKGEFHYQPYKYPDFDIEMQAVVHTGSKVTLLETKSTISSVDSLDNSVIPSLKDSLHLTKSSIGDTEVSPFYYLVTNGFSDLEAAYAWANYLRGNFTQEVFVLPPSSKQNKFLVALDRYVQLEQALTEIKDYSDSAPHLNIWLYYLE